MKDVPTPLFFSKQQKRQSSQCPDTHRRSGKIQTYHGEIGVKRTRRVPKEIRHARHEDTDNCAEGNCFHQGVDCRMKQDKIDEEGIGQARQIQKQETKFCCLFKPFELCGVFFTISPQHDIKNKPAEDEVK